MLSIIIFVVLSVVGLFFSHSFVSNYLEGNTLKKIFSHIILVAIFFCFYILGKIF